MTSIFANLLCLSHCSPLLPRRACLVPAASNIHDPYDRKHHGDFDEYADNRGQCSAGVETEQNDRGSNSQFKEVAGTDERRWCSDAMSLAHGTIKQIR